MAAENLEPTIQHCIGRSLIHLPNSFSAANVTTGILMDKNSGSKKEAIDVLVRTQNGRPNFTLEVQKRKAELEDSGSPNVDVLREIRNISKDTALFRVQRIDDAYVSEVLVVRGNSVVTARLHSFRNEYAIAEEALMGFATRVDALDSAESTAQGREFCLGSVKIRGDFSAEKANFLFRNGLGSQFDINVDTYAPDDHVPLLVRMSRPDSLLKIFDVRHTVLRARERTVAGMRAQEWLGAAQTSEDQGSTALQFTLETMRPIPSKATPGINLTFETAQPLEDGSQTKTLISEQQAIQLWDSVVASLQSTSQ